MRTHQWDEGCCSSFEAAFVTEPLRSLTAVRISRVYLLPTANRCTLLHLWILDFIPKQFECPINKYRWALNGRQWPWYKQVTDCDVHVYIDLANIITTVLSVQIKHADSLCVIYPFISSKCERKCVLMVKTEMQHWWLLVLYLLLICFRMQKTP